MAISRSRASSRTAPKPAPKATVVAKPSTGISTKPNTNSIGVSVPTKPRSSGSSSPKPAPITNSTPNMSTINGPAVGKGVSYSTPAPAKVTYPKSNSSTNMSTVNGSAVGSGVSYNAPKESLWQKVTKPYTGSKRTSSANIIDKNGDSSFYSQFGGGSDGGGESSQPSRYADFQTTSYKGTPGLEQSSFSTTASRGSTPASTGGNAQGYADRESQRQMIAQAEAQKQANITNIQGQLSALQSQYEETKANEGLMPSSLDEFGNPVPKESDALAKQLQALEKAQEEAMQDSPEVLAAKQEEDRLIAEEANIKAGLSGSVAEVKDQPIPFGFITGQQSALENRANAKLEGIAASKVPLQLRLAQLQQKKQAALDLVRSQIASKRDDRDYLRQSEKEKRQRGYQLTDQATKNAREDQLMRTEQANIDKKFEEDKRRFGLEYALRVRQTSIDQMNANTAKYKAENSSSSNDLPSWLQ